MLRKLYPGVKPFWLLLLAGLLWSAVGIMLTSLAFLWWEEAPLAASLPLAVVGLVACPVIYQYGFARLAQKNAARIGAVTGVKCVFAFLEWKNWLMVGVMMGFGLLLRNSAIPKPLLAAPYLGIGGSLFFASLTYYRRLLSPAGRVLQEDPIP